MGTTPSTSTFMFIGKRVSSSLARNSCSIITPGATARFLGSMTTRTSSADSSRTSATSGSFLSFSSSASFSMSRDFWTM